MTSLMVGCVGARSFLLGVCSGDCLVLDVSGDGVDGMKRFVWTVE